MSDETEIVKLGHAGDGIAADGLFVPYSVPGDRVRVTVDGARGRIEEILAPGPSRVAPVCRHFGRCGGCALQMMAQEPYLAWKRESVATALKQRGFANAPVEDIRAVAPGTRRRAMFKARGGRKGAQLGFYEPESRVLVDLAECPVLVPELARLMPLLRARLTPLLATHETIELHATLSDSGIDLALQWTRKRDPDFLMALSELANALKLARLSWNGEALAIAAAPSLRIGKFTVALPIASFLQPTREGEHILQELVSEAVAGAGAVADLFCGIGTFALALAQGRAVYAADSVVAQVEALAGAARAGQGTVMAETRDLFRRPLVGAELSRFGAVVLDPPRAGAPQQARALAQSSVPRIAYVSCNAASFARDARTLADGGYRLARVVPVDQFLWSPHVELFAVFTKP
jgi:23S rRNA (uracil1939-C5)-methyltransferase